MLPFLHHKIHLELPQLYASLKLLSRFYHHIEKFYTKCYVTQVCHSLDSIKLPFASSCSSDKSCFTVKSLLEVTLLSVFAIGEHPPG